jgi:hypothetical protein
MKVPPVANGVAVAIALALACSTAQAQWSIGPVGGYQATPGKNRYLYLVFANPVPGMDYGESAVMVSPEEARCRGAVSFRAPFA